MAVNTLGSDSTTSSGDRLYPVTGPRFGGFTKRTTFDDWFLPSREELKALMEQWDADGSATKPAIFHDDDDLNSNGRFWTSSESSATEAYLYHRLTDAYVAVGKLGDYDPADLDISVLPIRVFTDSDAEYSLGDTGPAGGYVFYINDTTVYEARNHRIALVTAWSNITTAASDATGTAIGTGASNTGIIVWQTGHTTSAAKLCYDFVESNIDANIAGYILYIQLIRQELVQYAARLATLLQQGNRPSFSKKIKLMLLRAYVNLIEHFLEAHGMEVDENFFTVAEFEEIMKHINTICNSTHWLDLE